MFITRFISDESPGFDAGALVSYKQIEVRYMRIVFLKYHEAMFNFWYCRNSAFRDYHGKKYHQLRSLPTVSSGLNFRSYKQIAVVAAQCLAVAGFYAIMFLGLFAQFV